MFGIGSTELILILLVALVVLGPKSLPKVANSIGKAMGEFRRASTDFQRSLNTEIAMEEHNEKQKQTEAPTAEPAASKPEPAPANASAASSTSEDKA